ncbi:hypothetical protein EYF80_057010 [Liparis tanakae]|uniref:Uncharacterized protein n=1 Tax=Liparis tanakae TaxID=230148 RepID=A0A4Z2EV60_9TELE|nr:hypothetical protein EYF80_057010 [Liparis tanakae]
MRHGDQTAPIWAGVSVLVQEEEEEEEEEEQNKGTAGGSILHSRFPLSGEEAVRMLPGGEACH